MLLELEQEEYRSSECWKESLRINHHRECKDSKCECECHSEL